MIELNMAKFNVKNPQTGEFEPLNGASQARVQSDWNQTDNSAEDFIKNKPTIPAAQVNSDWAASSGAAEILNKPLLGTAAAKDYTTSVSGLSDDLITSSAVNTALANKADLENGKVPASQLPSYVDDVLEYSSTSSFPATGENGKIYIATNTNKTYRWSGSTYVEISESLALGETSMTAYAGNKGKQNADNIGTMSALTTTAKSSLVEAVNEVDQLVSLGAGLKVEGQTFVVDDVSYTAKNGAEIFNNYANNKAIGEYSHAEGFGTVALGSEAHSEGAGSEASGYGAHAEGLSTQATNDSAHSEGWGTKATGKYSHAEGHQSEATNDAAHAEGTTAKAQGNSSHAEGNGTLAGGFASHAEGDATKALGSQSHAAGSNTIALGNNQYVIGKFNQTDSQNKYAFIIGNGDVSNTSNALSVDWNGLIYTGNSGKGVNVQELSETASRLVDAGAKNLVDMSNPSAVHDTDYTPLTDGGVKLSCSSKVWTQYIVTTEVTAGKNYVFSLKVANVTGDLSSGYIFIRDEGSTNYFEKVITEAGEYIARFTPATSIVRIMLYVNNSSTAKTVSLDAYGMLCTSEDYAISQESVPYAPSNRELYEEVEKKASLEDILGVGTTITNNANMDSLTGIGKWYCVNAPTAVTVTNAPFTDAAYFGWTIRSIASSDRYVQIAIKNSDDFVIAKRRYSGVWSAWSYLTGTAVT